MPPKYGTPLRYHAPCTQVGAACSVQSQANPALGGISGYSVFAGQGVENCGAPLWHHISSAPHRYPLKSTSFSLTVLSQTALERVGTASLWGFFCSDPVPVGTVVSLRADTGCMHQYVVDDHVSGTKLSTALPHSVLLRQTCLSGCSSAAQSWGTNNSIRSPCAPPEICSHKPEPALLFITPPRVISPLVTAGTCCPCRRSYR